MDFLTPGLLVVILILLLVQFVRTGRAKPGEDVAALLAEHQKLLRDELDRLQNQLDKAIRESAAEHQRELQKQNIDAVKREAETKQQTLALIADKSKELQNEVTAVLAQGRKSQDERLDIFGNALNEFRQTVTKESAAQKEALTDSLTNLQGRLTAQLQERLDRVDQLLKEINAALTKGMGEQKLQLTQMGNTIEGTQKKGLADLQTSLAALKTDVEKQNAEFFNGMREKIGAQLESLRTSNEAKLELIRGTVDEKLQTTLEKKLGESFRTVSTQLESVQKGLGEMQALANGVGDLKRVLSNVKTRGTFGETQLAALLEQVLHPSQYETNAVVVPNANERVEFAIRLPGNDANSPVYLAIDAKFPTEDYERLQMALEAADKPAIDSARAALKTRLLNQAATIREKYVRPPHTTDFALLYLPTEGLYAEALRIDGLLDTMQRAHRVIPVGPTTLYAILNSLQMGFRTLAIQERSSEVWSILSAVKTNFEKFGMSLKAVSKKLHEASNKVDAAEVASRRITRSLKGVEVMDTDKAATLIPLFDTDGEDEEDEDEEK
ncbi:MAG: recombination protein RmuC [Candidatus Sumerlaeota bacterium]|nr:recombination protein RmuC [Candidatus Sumerlaeota bacterium]